MFETTIRGYIDEFVSNKTCFRTDFPYRNRLTMVIITIREQFMKKKSIKKCEKKKSPFWELSFKTTNKSLHLSQQLLFCDTNIDPYTNEDLLSQ